MGYYADLASAACEVRQEKPTEANETVRESAEDTDDATTVDAKQAPPADEREERNTNSTFASLSLRNNSIFELD